METIREVLYSIYDHINKKAETVARWALGANSVQPEPVRVPASDFEQSVDMEYQEK